ncbi:MAG: hypothetical protein FMNOHCHN_03750 [Ignavibacteriaceae bacterium]|nr:hypothetical protein [Ignavibacteriaceae bacterium]
MSSTFIKLPLKNSGNGISSLSSGSSELIITNGAGTVYNNTTAYQRSEIIEWMHSSTTDANGVITFYPTSDGTSGGTALFSTIFNVQVTTLYNTTTRDDVPLASVRSIAADRKSIVVQVVEGTGVLLGGVTIIGTGSGRTVYKQVTGI